MKSEKIELLVKALIKAKAQIKPVEKNTVNPFFKSKYADLGAVEAAVKSALQDNGLVVVQTTEVTPAGAVLETTLLHESGQWIAGQYPLIPAKNDPQGMGSATTYARRYALSAILGVVSDEDDDGAASQPKTESHKQEAQEHRPGTGVTGGRVISEAQGKRLYALWKTAGKDDNAVKDYIKAKYGFNSTRDITSDKYEEICEWVAAKEEVPF